MKTHAIVPIFLPHAGCPNDCVFCNQRAITARQALPAPAAVRETIDLHLSTLRGRGIRTVEIAFFGGSFTGLPAEAQDTYLAIAREYKEHGAVDRIRLSTRPDYIDDAILDNLARHCVDTIELGVQSLDDGVLAMAGRGHDSAAVYHGAGLIRARGFTLGIQLMIGLPGDTFEKSLRSAEKAAAISPDIARIYPTVILEGTALARMYERGDYAPLAADEAVRTAKAMCLALRGAGVNVIRIGLKSSDFITNSRAALGDTYHPAFRQLVESAILRDILEAQLAEALDIRHGNGRPAAVACFTCPPDSLSDMIGHKKSNRLYFEEKYSPLRFLFRTDASLPDGVCRTALIDG